MCVFVDVPSDGSNNDLARALDALFEKERSQKVHSRVHGFRRKKDLGKKHLTVLELLPHDVHTGNEPVVEDVFWEEALSPLQR